MWLGKKHQEVLMTNYTLDFKTISFKNFILWEIVAWKPDFAAVSRTHDMHRLALLIHSCARSICLFLFEKASYPTQCCPANALAWTTQIRIRIRVCQRIMKTPARLLTGHVKSSKANVCSIFLRLGKKLILPSDFKTLSFEKFILWEKAVRKLDSSPVGIESPCC